jgi:hypothetical protein
MDTLLSAIEATRADGRGVRDPPVLVPGSRRGALARDFECRAQGRRG